MTDEQWETGRSFDGALQTTEGTDDTEEKVKIQKIIAAKGDAQTSPG